MVAVALAKKNSAAVAFGVRLRELREAKGWTQAELGERAEMMYQEISRMERGERLPTWETLLKLADALDESLDSFRHPDQPSDDLDPPDRPAGKRK
jgi:transcriptional regulator with XRE-family HTH domain